MEGKEIRKVSFRSEWTSALSKQPEPWRAKRWLQFLRKECRLTLLLLMLGVSASLVDDIIDMVVLGLSKTRREFLNATTKNQSTYIDLIAWSAFTIVVAIAGVKWTEVFDPMAAGSGIPEMKSIISYDHREDASEYLRARTLISKIGGLALALSSGLSLGKEGPFVHTSSIIAHRLMKHVKWFYRIYESDIMRRHVYNAACAVGVTCTFRAPIGGALFAIEVTSTVFVVSAESFRFAEILAFAVLAVFTGLLGAMYASVSTTFRQHWRAWTAKKSVVVVSWVLLIPLAAILCMPVGLGRLSFSETLTDLISDKPTLPDRWHADLSLSVYMVLPLAGLIRLVATTISTTLPIPAGDFVPTFIAGAAFGRLFGEVLRLIFPSARIVAGGYALAGGAGFVASTTNTTSVAVIAMEFTGQFVYTIPLILSTLVASGVGCALRVSVYDSVIAKKGFSYLCTLDLEGLKARDAMLRRFPILTPDIDLAQLRHTLNTATSTLTLPIVENPTSMIFVGCVARCELENTIRLVTDSEYQDPFYLRSALKMPQQAYNAIPLVTEPKEDADIILAEFTSEVKPILSAIKVVFDVPNARKFVQEAPHALVQPLLEIDSTALQVDPDTPLQKVHLLFEMIKCSSIWVTRQGRLVGLLHRQNLHIRVAELKRKACPSLPARSGH
ncbi:Chloride channel protein 2 [Phytophthora nicotianae]|uniref:Chloride channel protein 2 n=1 Tax=Phytophthora nicotianae TaxID=4792 RepID=A0A0W8CGE9_PHYNI|nr:Chloride channel protein 2 [Phytophthora nicotianae]